MKTEIVIYLEDCGVELRKDGRVEYSYIGLHSPEQALLLALKVNKKIEEKLLTTTDSGIKK